VVFVATMYDSVYAFDADTPGAPLWSVNLATLVGATPVPIAQFAIPPAPAGPEAWRAQYARDRSVQQRHVCVAGLWKRQHGVPSTRYQHLRRYGTLWSGRTHRGELWRMTFDANFVIQRTSLALANGKVIIGFSALESEQAGNYCGWVLAYNETTSRRAAPSPPHRGKSRGGICNRTSARGGRIEQRLSVRGQWIQRNGYDGVNNFAESALKFSTASGLSLIDWFTPPTGPTWMNTTSISAGPALLIQHFMAGRRGKSAAIYLMNTGNMGRFNSKRTSGAGPQYHPRAARRTVWCRLGGQWRPLMYTGATLAPSRLLVQRVDLRDHPAVPGSGKQIFPGGILALSASADTAGTGILWALSEINNGAPNGELHAFNAANVSIELYNTTMNASRDSPGKFAKFAPPTVVNGKVYVPTFSEKLAVYGLLDTDGAAQVKRPN